MAVKNGLKRPCSLANGLVIALVSAMAESWITYSISRPYPNRWITPLVILGGVILVVLFSLLNYVSSGFFLSLQYVTNPNATIVDAAWMNRWPSYFRSQLKPECQPQDIQINSVFSTNQSALMYTLMSVWITPDGQTRILQPGLTYMNNPIENCSIQNIHIDFEAEDRTATQYGWNAWGLGLQAFITCSIKTEGGTTFFNLTSNYDFVPSTAQFPTGDYNTQVGTFSFLTRNATSKASLWWGESLLAQYWCYVSSLMQDTRARTNNNLRKGTIHFLQPNTRDNIKDLDFWKVDSRFIVNTDGQGKPYYWDSGYVEAYNPTENLSTLAAGKSASKLDVDRIWIPSDGLAKSFYSTILVDLGQVNAKPNILIDEDALQFFTRNFTHMQVSGSNAQPGPARDSYNALKKETGPLELSPAVISSKYTCQIPRRKSPGTLFVSILIADLVLLQASWKLFSLCASSWFTHKYPEGNYCAGCDKRSVMHERSSMEKPEQRSLITEEEHARSTYEDMT